MFKNAWSGKWHGNSPDGDSHKRSREVVKHTGITVRGKFPSRKNGRMVHHESLLELDAIYLFETSFRIKRYREQPPKISYVDGEKMRRYTPDFELLLGTDEIVLIEVKHSESLEHKDTYLNLKIIEDSMQKHDIDFMIMTDKVIRLEPRLSNLRWIHAESSRIWPTSGAIKNALALHEGLFPMPLQDAIAIFEKININVFSLIMTGNLTLDLNNPITPETIIGIRKDSYDASVWIAQEYGF